MTTRGWPIKSKRRLLGLLVFLSVLSTCFALTIYGFLRSSYVQKRVLASIRQPLTELGVELKFDDFEVDVFAGFNFVNLRLKIDTPPTLKANISIQKARLRYGFWALIRQKLELDNATLKGLEGSITLKLPPAKEIQSKKELSLKYLVSLIKKPSFTLAVPNLDISDIKLHVAVTQGENFTEFDIKETEVSSQVLLQPDAFKLRLKASMIASARRTLTNLQTSESRETNKTILAFDQIKAQPDLNLEIFTANNQLDISLNLDKSQFQLDGLTLSAISTEPSRQSNIHIQKLIMNPNLKLSRKDKVDPDRGFMELIKSLKTNGQIRMLVTNMGLEQRIKQEKITTSSAIEVEEIKLNQNWDAYLDQNSALSQANWAMSHSTGVRGIRVRSSAGASVATQAASLNISSKVKDGNGSLKSRLSIKQIESHLLAKPADLEQSADLSLNFHDGNAAGELVTKINDAKILDARLKTSGNGTKLELNSEFRSTFPKVVTDLMPELKQIADLGWPETTGRVNLTMVHPRSWEKFQMSDWPKLDAELNAGLTVLPTVKNNQTMPISFKSASTKVVLSLSKQESGENYSKFKSTIETDVADLISAAMTSPTSISSRTTIEAKVGDETTGELKHSSAADGESFITMTTKWVDKTKLFNAEHYLEVSSPTKIVEKLREPRILAAIGALGLKSNSTFVINHPKKSLLRLRRVDLPKTTAKLAMTQSIEQRNNRSAAALIALKKPIKADTSAVLGQNRLDLQSKIEGQSLAYGKLAEATGMDGSFEATVNNIEDPTSASMDIRFGIKAVKFLATKTASEFDRSLRDLTFSAKSSLAGDTIKIRNLEGGLKDGTLKFDGQGEFKTYGTGQLDGKITSRLLQENALISGSGQFNSPVKLIIFDRQRISLEAKPSFENFSIKIGEFSAKNVNGELAILEELELDKTGKIGFLYLKTQNPFARVDYENVEPYLGNKSRITFDEVAWKHIVIGPMIQSFEMRQNLVLLNDLKIDLLDGSMVGRFYLDLHPSRLRTGFLGRFSGLKPELLKAPEQRAPLKDWAAFAGRMAVDFDMRKRLASGRMDFTQIGKKQLLSLLDVVDPELKDNQITLARKGLKIAYPKKVGISMDHGLMDLAIDLDGALSQTVGVRSLPLSGLINAQAGEVLSDLESMLN
ncbi:MAG: hypothetical protein WCL28_01720 [bacterium]